MEGLVERLANQRKDKDKRIAALEELVRRVGRFKCPCDLHEFENPRPYWCSHCQAIADARKLVPDETPAAEKEKP